MKKENLLTAAFMLSYVFMTGFTWQENTTSNTALTIYLIIIFIIAILVILFGGIGKMRQPSNEDDLTKIEGIGPKISVLLKQNGINTFDKLAKANVANLEKMLNNAGLQMANSDTWPRQARLAANGKWDELKKLQDELTGGRAN